MPTSPLTTNLRKTCNNSNRKRPSTEWADRIRPAHSTHYNIINSFDHGNPSPCRPVRSERIDFNSCRVVEHHHVLVQSREEMPLEMFCFSSFSKFFVATYPMSIERFRTKRTKQIQALLSLSLLSEVAKVLRHFHVPHKIVKMRNLPSEKIPHFMFIYPNR